MSALHYAHMIYHFISEMIVCVFHNQLSSFLDSMRSMYNNARDKDATRTKLVMHSWRDVSAQRGRLCSVQTLTSVSPPVRAFSIAKKNPILCE